MRDLLDAQREFSPVGVYLDSASMGLPPRSVSEAVRGSLEAWSRGQVHAPSYDVAVERSRSLYADLVGVPVTAVAVGSQVSAFAGLVAAGLPDGAEVLTVEGEFTSIVFPFLVQASRGVTVRDVPLESLAEEVRPSTSLVAVSAVQSSDGRLVDLDALEASGARVLLDTTQAVGWLPVDASRFAWTTGGGYKWLLAPRGTAFFTENPALTDGLVPHAAGWYAGEDPWTSIYGGPLRLSCDARRYDVSPAWHSWVGQAAALELLSQVGAPALHAHAVGLAEGFREQLGIAPSGSAIVSLPAGPRAAERLAGAGVKASVRAGGLRLAFHVHNTSTDVEVALQALA